MIRLVFILSMAVGLASCGGGKSSQQLGGVDFGNPAAPTDPVSGGSTFLTSQVLVDQDWADGFHLADINADGNIDMLVSGNPQVMLGNGDGTFRTGQNFDSNYSFRSLQTGDFNGDGKIDLVYKQPFSPQISVRFGNGDGTFGARVDLADSPSMYLNADLRVADMNEDGIDDIVVLSMENSNSSVRDSVSVRLSDGRGGFRTSAVISTPIQNSWVIRIADINGDGHLDVVSGHSEQWGTFLYRGDGKGGLSSGSTSGQPMGGYSMLLGDFNRDGFIDELIHISDTVTISLGASGAKFLTPYNASLDIQAFDHSDTRENPAIADLNNDGILDVITADNTRGTISIHKGDGRGAFKTIGTLSGVPNALVVDTADLDHDGLLDVIVKPGNRKSTSPSLPVSIFMNVAKSSEIVF